MVLVCDDDSSQMSGQVFPLVNPWSAIPAGGLENGVFAELAI
jgi:hypothetical protein